MKKLIHKVRAANKEADDRHRALHVDALADPAVDMVTLENAKIKGAIRTDFILSAEIIVIALGTVAKAPLGEQVTVLVLIAVLMTVGVYGVVAAIVKLDDGGMYLSRQRGDGIGEKIQRSAGGAILRAAPYLMKGISIAGTAAMFLVGGGILTHGIPDAAAVIETLAQSDAAIFGSRGIPEGLTSILLQTLAGVVAGAAVLAGVSVAACALHTVKRLF